MLRATTPSRGAFPRSSSSASVRALREPLGKLCAPGTSTSVVSRAAGAGAPRPACRTCRCVPCTTHDGSGARASSWARSFSGCPGRWSGKLSSSAGVGLERPGRAARDPRAGAAAPDDERSRQPAAAGHERLDDGHPGGVERRRPPGHPAPGDEPRLLDEHDGPARADEDLAGDGEVDRAEPSPGAVAEDDGAARAGGSLDVGASGPARRLDLADRLADRGASRADHLTRHRVDDALELGLGDGLDEGRVRCCASPRRRGSTGCASKRPGAANSRTLLDVAGVLLVGVEPLLPLLGLEDEGLAVVDAVHAGVGRGRDDRERREPRRRVAVGQLAVAPELVETGEGDGSAVGAVDEEGLLARLALGVDGGRRDLPLVPARPPGRCSAARARPWRRRPCRAPTRRGRSSCAAPS